MDQTLPLLSGGLTGLNSELLGREAPPPTAPERECVPWTGVLGPALAPRAAASSPIAAFLGTPMLGQPRDWVSASSDHIRMGALWGASLDPVRGWR